jgi:hypothetical protein
MIARTAAIALALAAVASAKECTVEYTEGQDDSPAILSAFQECAQDSVITFQQKNYSAYTPVTLSNLSAYLSLRSLGWTMLTQFYRERDCPHRG